jgi:hypothetical protein
MFILLFQVSGLVASGAVLRDEKVNAFDAHRVLMPDVNTLYTDRLV